ncbi:MAG: ParA family protein [Elusimicrobiota bacterium]|nr:ParA family protein [Elusimicrobiota bacterium]
MIIAIINNKGGTAKTTSAVNLAAALTIQGARTLLIDLDSQASASLSMGIERAAFAPSIADAVLAGKSLKPIIRKTGAEGLDLVTGSPDMAEADLTLANLTGRERRLKAAIEPIRGDYDFIILDCPPSLSLLSVNAMVAADAFIIPTPPEYLALEGLVGLMAAVQKIHAGIGDKCRLLGILLTKVDHRRKVTEEIIGIIRNHYKDQVFKTEVGVDVRLVEAPSFGKTIFEYDRSSSGAVAYLQLAREITRKGKKA